MAKISTYGLDAGLSADDILLGSSYEGIVNGNPIYNTRNYRLADLATFFQSYDADLNTSLSTLQSDVNTLTTSVNGLDSRVTTLEGASGVDLTAFSVSTNPVGTAALTYNNANGVFTYTPPDLTSYLTSVAFADLTGKPTTIAGYGITDAFDGSYASLTNVPTAFTPASHNHDDRYYTETEVDTLLSGYLSTSTNIGDLANVSSATPSTGQVLKWNGAAWAPGTDLQASGGTGISLTDLSVSVNAAGTANLSYDNTSGTFTYTPPNVSGYISLTSISVGTDASPSGNGGLAYNNTTGVFTYTPPDFSSGYLATSGGTLTGNLILSSGANLTLQGGNVSVTGNVTASGVISGTNLVGNITGDIYSNGPGSILVLENGSGGTPNAYFIGDLTTGSGGADLVFDTSEATFRKNVKIGTSTENLDLDLGETSQIVFARGTQQQQIISATSTSNWDAAYDRWVRDIEFSEPTAGEIAVTLVQGESETPGTPYTRALGVKILEGAGLTFSTSSGQLTMAVDSTEVLFINQLSNNVVTGLSIDEGGSVTNVGSGAIKFIAGNNISLAADGTQKTITLNTTSDVLTTSYSKITEWDEAHDSNITSLNFASGTTADKIDINLVTRDAGVADINLADILREGTGITMSADATGFLTLSVNTNTIATRTWVTGQITNNTITSATVKSGAAITGDLNFTDGTHITALRDGATNNVSFNFDNSVAGFITQSTLNNFTGSSNITTLGTISTGTWQGSNIAAAYLPSTIPYTTANQSWGNFTLTAGDFILNSDRDLKENIIPLAKREIKVDFKEYNFKGSNRTRFGVIAQELEEHHPEFVHTRERGEKSVSYIDLLVAKIHELEGRIKELENGSRNG